MKTSDDFRPWHYLRPLANTTTPANIIVFDTETYPVVDAMNPGKERHYLRLWVAKAFRYEQGRQSRVEEAAGNTKDGFWDFAISRSDKKRPLWLFAHNAGFDLTVTGFWHEVLNGRFEFKQEPFRNDEGEREGKDNTWTGVAVLNDPPTICKFRLANQKNTFVVVDTFNYFRASLKDIGESIGCGKAEQPPYNAPDQVWLDYCKQDVAVLEKAVCSLIDLVRNEKLGKFSYTASGQAMNAFKARFLTEENRILIHGNRQANQLERQSYHGGAVHCLFIGRANELGCRDVQAMLKHDTSPVVRGPIYHLDKNSFYPWIMRENVFPCKLKALHLTPGLNALTDQLEHKGVIAAVGLDCAEPGFPVTRNGKTFYAKGKLRTTLAYPELKRAIAEGAVKKIWAMATYQTAPLFKEFVDYFFALRKKYEIDGNKAFAFMCKTIMNSLYGRFGMKSYKWENDANAIPPIPFGYWWDKPTSSDQLQVYRSLCWLPQRQCTSDCPDSTCSKTDCINPGHCQRNPLENIDSFTAIASYVTSYGREEILRLVSIAGVENCLYSDTDSLHVTQDGLNNLDNANEVFKYRLGSLKIVSVNDTAEYRGYKDYTLGNQLVMSGLRPGTKPDANGDLIQPRFQRLASVLAGNELDSIAVQRIKVTREAFVPLGGVDENGRVQLPLLNEW